MNREFKIQTYTLNKLQMFDECPQKYKLCYIDKIHIIENTKQNNASTVGTNIHNIINAYLKGQNIEKLISVLSSQEKILWQNFKNNEIEKLKYLQSEYSFNIKLDNYWLTGRLDALFYDGENYIIYDWKTGEKLNKDNLKFQTSFYLLCVYEILKSKKIIQQPENLSMHYLDLYKNNLIKIEFSFELYQQYKKLILDIINKMNDNKLYLFNKTSKCKYCKYYSVCPYI